MHDDEFLDKVVASCRTYIREQSMTFPCEADADNQQALIRGRHKRVQPERLGVLTRLEFGCENRSSVGARFWYRLTRVAPHPTSLEPF